MNGRTLIGIIVVIIIIALGWWWYASMGSSTPAPTDQAASPSGVTQTGTSINPQSQNQTITYTNQGFSPQSVTIIKGATVTFVNQSSNPMWIASAPHPAHAGYDGTSRTTHCAAGYTDTAPFDECAIGAAGTSWSFTFDKVGTWPFHNHSGAEDFGSVTVTAPVEGGPTVTGSATIPI